VKLASLALDKAIDESEGKVELDVTVGILLTKREAGQLLETFGIAFREKSADIVPILEH